MAYRSPLYAAGSSRDGRQTIRVKPECPPLLDPSMVVSAHGCFSRMPNPTTRNPSMGNPSPQGQRSNQTAQNQRIAPYLSPKVSQHRSQSTSSAAPVQATPQNRAELSSFDYQPSEPEPVATVDHEEEVVTHNQSSTESDEDLEILLPGQTKLYQCKLCSKCFPTGLKLGQHSRLSHSLKFSCSVCDQRSRTADIRNKHEKNAHGLIRGELIESEERLSNKTLKGILRNSNKEKFRGKSTRTIKDEPVDENDPMTSTNIPTTPRTESRPINNSLTSSPNPQTSEAPNASRFSFPIIVVERICKILGRRPTIIFYDIEERQKQLGSLPLEIYRDVEDCRLLLVRARTATIRNPELVERSFQKIEMQRVSSNGTKKSIFLCCVMETKRIRLLQASSKKRSSP
ncbi:hypothetical protein M3Y94_00956000 [Aphelenchoides besseyi]|nr:hypothetical protein M3Y94_00956000 [Aphelenchoides besseyi]